MADASIHEPSAPPAGRRRTLPKGLYARGPAWAAVAVIAAVWLAAHLTAFLAAGNLFNADAAIAGMQAFLFAQKGVFPIFLANQSYMGMAPAWVAAGLVKLFGPHLWTLTLAWGLFGAASFGILIDGLDRYVSRRAALAFVLLAMFMALAPLNTLRPSGHVMGLLGAAILLRWILKYRDIRSLPVAAASFLGFGVVIGFFWYSDEIIVAALIPFAIMLVWAFFQRPRLTAALAGVLGLLVGYFPALLYRLEGGKLVLHTGITTLAGLVGNIRIMLQAFSWGMFSIPYASHPAAIATGLFILALSAAFLFWTPWETLATRALVLSPLYVNMILYSASTMPIDMYSIRYLYPGLYTLGIATAIFVAGRTRAVSAASARRLVPVAALVCLAALAYDGQSFVHGVAATGPDATVQATRSEAAWLVAHHDTIGWGYYWDVYMLDLMGYPHLTYAANTNLNIPSVAQAAAAYCQSQGACPVILNAPPTSAVFRETPTAFSPASLGTLQFVKRLQQAHGYFVYQAESVPSSSS